MSPLDHLLLLILSFVSNLLSALAGGGAGLIQLPVIIFLGLNFSVALATHKVASIALGVGATFRHLKEGSISPKFSAFILLCGLPGVVVGATVIVNVPANLAQISLGVLTISLGIYSWLKPELGEQTQSKNRETKGLIIGGAVLFFIGFLNGSLTSGTGLFVTIWLVRWFGLEYKLAIVYTLILVGLFWNGTGAFTLGIQSQIAWDWLPALLLGSLVGGYVGAHLAISKGNKFIKRIFEVTAIAVGVRLIFISATGI